MSLGALEVGMGRYDRRRDACSGNCLAVKSIGAAEWPDELAMVQNSCDKGEKGTGTSCTRK